MDITGTIILKFDRQSGVSKAGREWKKDEYVLETDGPYPKRVKFTVFGDKCDAISLELQHKYTLSFDLESREFNGRWYTDVNVYAAKEEGSMDNGGGFAPAQVSEAPAQMASVAPGYDNGMASAFGSPVGDKVDDLPF